MLINGEDLTKSIVQILIRESELIKEVTEINQKYETALNLGDSDKMMSVIIESAKIQYRFKAHVSEKIIVMTMAISRNRNFGYN